MRMKRPCARTQLVLTAATAPWYPLIHAKSSAKSTRRAGVPCAEPIGRQDAPLRQGRRLRGVPAGHDPAHQRHPIRILSYCVLSNHWHFAVWPDADGQVLPLLRQQSLGGTRNTDIYRSGRDWSGDRREIALRDREVRSSLTIHVCFLRETVFVPTNNPNMEETGSLENPILSGKCDLDLNRARSDCYLRMNHAQERS